MNYLTNFYKNRCEVLNEELSILKRQLAFLIEAGDPKDERSAPPPPPGRGDDQREDGRGSGSGSMGGGRGQGGGQGGGQDGGDGPILDVAPGGMSPAEYLDFLNKLYLALYIMANPDNYTPEEVQQAGNNVRRWWKLFQRVDDSDDFFKGMTDREIINWTERDRANLSGRPTPRNPQEAAREARRVANNRAIAEQLYGEGAEERLQEIIKALRNGTYKGPRTITIPGPPPRTINLDIQHPNYQATDYYPLNVGDLPAYRPPNAPGATTPATWVPATGEYAPGYWRQTGSSPFGGSQPTVWQFVLNPNGPGGGWVYQP